MCHRFNMWIGYCISLLGDRITSYLYNDKSGIFVLKRPLLCNYVDIVPNRFTIQEGRDGFKMKLSQIVNN